MKKIIALGCVFLVAYLLLWPVAVDPQPWPVPEPARYEGVFAKNYRLSEFTKLSLPDLHGPEALAQDSHGNLYTSTHEGWIVRWQAGQEVAQKWINLKGRPLGLAFDEDDNLWVANAYVGLMKVTPEKEVTVELTRTDDVDIRYIDDLAIAPNGMIYLSDASTKFSAKRWGGTLPASLLDLMEHGRYGRIIEFSPSSGESREIMSGLSFANGVAIDESGDFMLVIETGEYRVWKYWLSGERQGFSDVISSGFPGFPDNIHKGQNGRFWLGLTAPRSSVLDQLADKPFMRKIVQRFPEFLRPKVLPYGMVIAIDGEGKVLENLQDPEGAVYATTGALETDDAFYVTSLTAPFLAKYDKNNLQLK